MNNKIKAFAATAVSFIVGGCASLDSFKEMTAYERAKYACSSKKDIRSFDKRIKSSSSAISELESVIATGYRTHKSCKQVQVNSGVQNCTSRIVLGTIQTDCGPSLFPSYRTVCEETPVAIDGDLEERKLKRHRDERKSLRQLRSDSYDRCHKTVQALSAEEAFSYYENHL